MKIADHIPHLFEENFNSFKYYKSDDHIFSEGELFNGVYYILEGNVKILRNGLNKQMTMWFGEPNQFIGIVPFFDNSKIHNSTAIAIESVKLTHINEQDFQELISTHIDIQKEIINNLCRKINLTEMRINNLFHHSARVRLIDTICFLAKLDYRKVISKNKKEIIINFSLENLSEISGISIKHLRKQVIEFRKKGLLELNGSSLIVPNLDRLILEK